MYNVFAQFSLVFKSRSHERSLSEEVNIHVLTFTGHKKKRFLKKLLICTTNIRVFDILRPLLKSNNYKW